MGKGDDSTIDPERCGPVVKLANPDLKNVLVKLCNLHLLARLEVDLPWFVHAKLLTPAQAEDALIINRKLCAEIAPLSLDLIDAFGLPEEILGSPIASEWVEFNKTDNQGELGPTKEFRKLMADCRPKDLPGGN